MYTAFLLEIARAINDVASAVRELAKAECICGRGGKPPLLFRVQMQFYVLNENDMKIL